MVKQAQKSSKAERAGATVEDSFGIGKPWEDAPDLWKDEASFLSKFMRGAVRKMWSRHPIKHRYKQSRVSFAVADAIERGLIAEGSVSKQTKKVKQCERCGKWKPASHLEVDHLLGGVGFSDHDGFVRWMHRMMWVGYDDIWEICKPCHSVINNMQKFGCSEELVPMHEERIAFGKLKAAPMKRKLLSLGLPEGKNLEERKQLFLEYLQEKYDVQSKESNSMATRKHSVDSGSGTGTVRPKLRGSSRRRKS